eukprot:236882-Amphidinium_carterae.1
MRNINNITAYRSGAFNRPGKGWFSSKGSAHNSKLIANRLCAPTCNAQGSDHPKRQPAIGTALFVQQVPVFGLRCVQHDGLKDIKYQKWSHRFCLTT